MERVPLIGITGSTDVRYQEKAFSAGAEFFLTKPIRPASLLHLVQLAVKLATKLAGHDTRASSVRRHPRFAAQVPVECLVGPDTKSPRETTGQTGNVCLGGVLLWLPEELSTGTVLRLRLELPKGKITAEGKVAWQDAQPIGQGTHGHGIKLVRFMEDLDLARYRNFLSDLAAGSASDGLDCLDLPEKTRQEICEYIESVSEEAKALPTSADVIRRSYTCEKCGKSFVAADSEVRPLQEEPRNRPVHTGDLFHYKHRNCQGTVMYTIGGPFLPWTAKKKA